MWTLATWPSRTRSPPGAWRRICSRDSGAGGRFREADDDAEAALAVDHFADGVAADGGFDHILDVVDVEAVAGEGVAVGFDVEFGDAVGDFHLGVRRAGDAFKDAEGFHGYGVELFGIFAEDLDGDIGLDAADGLVEAHGHGLGEVVRHAGDGFEGDAHLGDEFLFGGDFPLFLGVEDDVDVGFEDAHLIRCQIGTADLGDDAFDFGEGEEGLFDFDAELVGIR